MLILLLKHIMNSSETAIEDLLTNFRNLKLTDMEGENVNEMVLQLRTVHDTLVGASTPTRNYAPTNFCQDVLKVLQTSSCEAFNEIFKDEYNAVTRAAARKGGLTQWPDVEEMFSLATNSYADLNQQSNMWCLPTGTPGAHGMTPEQIKAMPFYKRPDYRCFNCGKGGHPIGECALPRDEARINKAKEAYRKQHPRKSNNKKGPKHKMGKQGKFKGKPLIRNKHGAYVLDTKKWKEMKAAASASTDQSNKEGSTSTPPLTDADLQALKAFHLEHKDELAALTGTPATPAPPGTPAASTPKPDIAGILSRL